MKKVLISLDDMKNLWDDPDVYGMREFRNLFEKWFDAQTDWWNWIQNAGRIMIEDKERIEAMLSKMQTTEAKE